MAEIPLSFDPSKENRKNSDKKGEMPPTPSIPKDNKPNTYTPPSPKKIDSNTSKYTPSSPSKELIKRAQQRLKESNTYIPSKPSTESLKHFQKSLEEDKKKRDKNAVEVKPPVPDKTTETKASSSSQKDINKTQVDLKMPDFKDKDRTLETKAPGFDKTTETQAPSFNDNKDQTLIDIKAPTTQLDEKLEEITDEDIVEVMSQEAEKQFKEIDKIKDPQEKLDKFKDILPLYFQDKAEKSAYVNKSKELGLDLEEDETTIQSLQERIDEIPDENQAIDAEIALDKATQGELNIEPITKGQRNYLDRKIARLGIVTSGEFNMEEYKRLRPALDKIPLTISESKPPKEKIKIASQIEDFRTGKINTKEAKLVLSSLYQNEKKYKSEINKLENDINQAEEVKIVIDKFKSGDINHDEVRNYLEKLSEKYAFVYITGEGAFHNWQDALYQRLRNSLESTLNQSIIRDINKETAEEAQIQSQMEYLHNRYVEMLDFVSGGKYNLSSGITHIRAREVQNHYDDLLHDIYQAQFEKLLSQAENINKDEYSNKLQDIYGNFSALYNDKMMRLTNDYDNSLLVIGTSPPIDTEGALPPNKYEQLNKEHRSLQVERFREETEKLEPYDALMQNIFQTQLEFLFSQEEFMDRNEYKTELNKLYKGYKNYIDNKLTQNWSYYDGGLLTKEQYDGERIKLLIQYENFTYQERKRNSKNNYKFDDYAA